MGDAKDPRLGGETLETVLYTYECPLMHDHLARRSWQRLRRYRIAGVETPRAMYTCWLQQQPTLPLEKPFHTLYETQL
jgi:hypothetical protein